MRSEKDDEAGAGAVGGSPRVDGAVDRFPELKPLLVDELSLGLAPLVVELFALIGLATGAVYSMLAQGLVLAPASA
jgi:hypothetical protein